ncbi:MAG: hypothetical protein DI562_06050 [Stenotrophomonas acidaminiphila]|nr:MAG: hypothetical protein DI562_06050 [Stenotrophomonas acidaminiphila]
MALDHSIRRSLPARAQIPFDQSDLSPTVLRLKFGPRMRLDGDDDSSGFAAEPKTSLGQSMAQYAKRAETTWLQIREAHFRSLADKSVDPGTAYLRSAKSAKRHLQGLDSESEQILQRMDERSAYIQKARTDALRPPTSVGDAQVDAEVRAMIRAEKNPAKAAAIAKAHPRAVATAPAVLSGLVDEDGKAMGIYGEATNAYLRATIPNVEEEAAELLDANDQFHRAMTAANDLTRSIIDFDLADKLHAGSQWDQAA